MPSAACHIGPFPHTCLLVPVTIYMKSNYLELLEATDFFSFYIKFSRMFSIHYCKCYMEFNATARWPNVRVKQMLVRRKLIFQSYSKNPINIQGAMFILTFVSARYLLLFPRYARGQNQGTVCCGGQKLIVVYRVRQVYCRLFHLHSVYRYRDTLGVF